MSRPQSVRARAEAERGNVERAGMPLRSRDLQSSQRRLASERSEEILRRLEDLFLDGGFAHLTVDALAKELKCSKSSLYAIASSREQLVVAVVKHFFRGAAAQIEARVRAIQDPRDRIAIYLASVGDEMRRMSRACYADMVAFGATRGIYDHNSRVAAGRVHDMIHDGIASGAFRPVHAEFVAEAVSLLIEGIQHGALLERTGLSSGDAYGELSTLVLAALTNGAKSGTDRRRSP